MSTLQKAPRSFDSLHTLKVWTPYGNLMVNIHETLNGERCPYTNVRVWTFRNRRVEPHSEPYSNEEVLASLAQGKEGLLRVQLEGGFFVEGHVASATRIETSATTWVLVFDGVLCRYSGDERLETPVRLVTHYDTEFGRGFCLLPELAKQQLWS